MGKYFEAVHPYLTSHQKLSNRFRPPRNTVISDAENPWKENEAMELIFGLSGIVYAGVLSSLNFSVDDPVKIARLPHKNTPNRKKIIEDTINARGAAVSQLFPKEDLTSKCINRDLSLLGIVGLGLIRTIFPDNTGEAMIRLSAISILLRNDPFAVLIRERFPQAFNGLKDVQLLLREQNLIGLPPKQLKEIYDTLNL